MLTRAISDTELPEAGETCGGEQLMTDVLGYRAVFGVIGPSTNTVVQPDFEAMRVPGVTNHYRGIYVTDPNALSDEDFMAGTQAIADNTSVVALSYPHSRGSISLRSANPDDLLTIGMKLLDDSRDVAALVRGCRIMRAIFEQPAIARHVVRERLPGAQVESDEALEAYVRATSSPTNHPMGTCRMGRAGEGAVDARLRLHGLDGLRIIDASVMPRHVSGNINAAVLMIAENGAAMIKADWD